MVRKAPRYVLAGRPTGLRAAADRWVRSTGLRGEGVGLRYRPSPRQLRRSSTSRMVLSRLAESRGAGQGRFSMRDARPRPRNPATRLC
ncbi:hypothetical protein EKH77_09925 [Streptomyces luteoverticillatus]|uniref:Uncharacterized protein n=1 Tax=Streptomyces luteoverticillatus TaxID=66425 RepID=A0A3Q9FXQ3_STRLT|nr:hypothetical protein EKH77_09925 [Streptomyces luteoverticillatus]